MALMHTSVLLIRNPANLWIVWPFSFNIIVAVLPFSNPPRNETKTRNSEEVAAAQIANGAFLTQVQMIRTTPSSAGRIWPQDTGQVQTDTNWHTWPHDPSINK